MTPEGEVIATAKDFGEFKARGGQWRITKTKKGEGTIMHKGERREYQAKVLRKCAKKMTVTRTFFFCLRVDWGRHIVRKSRYGRSDRSRH
jgi:hypothetical protein